VKKIIFLLLTLGIAVYGSRVYAVDLFPMQVGNSYEYLKHDSGSPANYWTVQIDWLETVPIGGNDYFRISVLDWYPGTFDYFLFRSTEDTVYYYDAWGEREFWRKAPVGTAWSYLDPDGEGITYAEIVSVDSLPWETGKSILEVPYGTYPFDNVYIHKKYYKTPGDFWYEYIVPGVGLVKEVDFSEDIAPPYIMELAGVTIVPEPAAYALFLAGGVALMFGSFRKKRKQHA